MAKKKKFNKMEQIKIYLLEAQKLISQALEELQEVPEPKPSTPPTLPHLPSLPNDRTVWKNHGVIIRDKQFAGFDYVIAGLFERNGSYGMIYQSKHNLLNKARSAGSLAVSDNLVNWMGNVDNPVLAGAMSWQGVDVQGRAHRTGVATLIEIEGVLYSYYRDREGTYTRDGNGMRAMGVATSVNGINWEQRDHPFITVRDVKRIVPARYFTGDPVFRRGRVYISHAACAEGYVYAVISTLVDGRPRPEGKYGHFLIRGKDPIKIDDWEFVGDVANNNEGFIFVGGKWLRVRRRSHEGVLGFNLQIVDSLASPHKNEIFIPSGSSARSIVPYYTDRLHVFFTDRDSPVNIHLISEVK